MKKKSPRIDIIAGARPNFMKIAPIIRAIEVRRRANVGGGLEIQVGAYRPTL